MDNTFCCDPFKVHKRPLKKGLKKVTTEITKKFPQSGIVVDQKICATCIKKLSIQDRKKVCVDILNEDKITTPHINSK